MPAQSPVSAVLRHAWQHSPFYRELYSAHGLKEADLDQVELHDLPTITKRMVVDHYDRVVTDPRITSAAILQWLAGDNDPRSRFLDEYLIVYSSGSFIRANFLYSQAGWRTITAAAAPYLFPQDQGGRTNFRSAYFVGRPGHVASYTAALNASQAGVERLMVSLFDPIETNIARLKAFQPDRLTTYSSSLAWLAELTLAGKLPIRPREVVVSSDRLTPAMERKVKAAWDPLIYDLYAAAESLFIGVRQPGQAEWKILEDQVRVEVVDSQNIQVEAGQTGRVLLTNLFNTALPLIRYDLTDHVICGDTRPGHVTIRAFRGRTYDFLPIRLPDGQVDQIQSDALAEFDVPGIDEFQFFSQSPDEVVIEYRAQANLDRQVETAFGKLLAGQGGSPTRYHARQVERILNDGNTWKLRLVRRPEDPLVGLPAHIWSAPPSEDHHPRLRPGGGFTPLGREILDTSIVTCFERQVSRSPESLAVSGDGVSLKYGELNRSANRVATALRERGLCPGSPVALFFDHTPAVIVAMLGVLKAGGCYVPIDPAHPPARIQAVLRETGVEWLVTNTAGLPQALAQAAAAGIPTSQVVNIDNLAGRADNNLDLEIAPGAPACVLFTSGSTGQPKPVLLDHLAVLHRALLYVNDYQVGPADRLSLLQLSIFNASLREIFGALLAGASLHLYSLRRDGAHHLAAWLASEEITVLYLTPPTFRVFLETLTGERFAAVRLVRLGGDAVLARDVEGFRRHFPPGSLLANGLAATETGTICQYWLDHNTPLAGSRIPSGKPVLDKDIHLVDETGLPVPAGMTGELVVISRFFGPPPGAPPHPSLVSPPGELPPERSVATGDLGYRLPDGNLILVGRKDWLVKVRGQRFNLLEIEQALLALPIVAEAAVTAHTAPGGDTLLVASLRPRSWPAPPEAELRRSLRGVLPDAMIPVVFQFLESLPKTSTGKIDRLALPAPDFTTAPNQAARVRAAPPETPLEIALAGIFSEMIKVDSVGAEESFFDLGGDSLMASQLMARIEQAFGRKLPLALLFEHDTVRGLARQIGEPPSAQLPEGLVTLQPLGSRAPLFFIPGIGGEAIALRDLVVCLGSDRPLYALQWNGFAGLAARPGGQETRTIVEVAGEFARLIQAVQPAGPYLLAGYSFGGHIALEIARCLRSPAQPEPALILLDTFPPVNRRQTTWKNRAIIHLTNLRRLPGPRGIADYLVERIRRLLLRWAAHRPARVAASILRDREHPALTAAQVALAVYRPQPYPGPAVLFQAAEREWYVDWDPMAAWKDFLSGELETRTLPGSHNSLVKPPYVTELARQLNQVLEQAEARSNQI